MANNWEALRKKTRVLNALNERARSAKFLNSFGVNNQKLGSMVATQRVSLAMSLQSSLEGMSIVEDIGDDETDNIFQDFMIDGPDEEVPSKAATQLKTGIASGLFLDDSVKTLNLNKGVAANLSVNCLSMKFPKHEHSEDPPECGLSDAARFQEIFVDLVSLHMAGMDAQCRHFLDDRFSTFLGQDEKEFKAELLNLLGRESKLSVDAQSTPAFKRLQAFMKEEMGYGGVSESQQDQIEKIRNLRGSVLASVAEVNKMNSVPEHGDNVLHHLINSVRSNEVLSKAFAFCAKGEDGKVTKEEVDRLLNLAILEDPDLKLEELMSFVGNPDFDRLFTVPGHVFVVNASVCDISCDAFLCPVGGNVGLNTAKPAGTIFPQWLKKIRERHPNILRSLMQHDSGGEPVEGPLPLRYYKEQGCDRVTTLDNWKFITPSLGTAHIPFLVAGEVSIERSRLGAEVSEGIASDKLPSQEEHLCALLETVRQYIKVASEELRKGLGKPFARRERYLLALPVVGTGGGHAADITGHIVERELRLLFELVAKETDVDCVLVCADDATFAHAQGVRSRLCPVIHDFLGSPRRTSAAFSAKQVDQFSPTLSCFGLLTRQMRDHALQLADLAKDQQLSFFIGAGVSMGAGAPSWFGLLFAVEDAFTENGLEEERKLGDECAWNPLLMADKLVVTCAERPDRMGVERSLKHRICDLISKGADNPSLLMSLIAGFPTKSIITQNYDELIEKAFDFRNIAQKIAGTHTLSVIPHTPRKETPCWLLKMHGCVSCPPDIVICSEDYEEYEAGRMKALGGLVQANLMTSHLLFLGFSMTDPNFMRIIQEVRHALNPAEE